MPLKRRLLALTTLVACSSTFAMDRFSLLLEYVADANEAKVFESWPHGLLPNGVYKKKLVELACVTAAETAKPIDPRYVQLIYPQDQYVYIVHDCTTGEGFGTGSISYSIIRTLQGTPALMQQKKFSIRRCALDFLYIYAMKKNDYKKMVSGWKKNPRAYNQMEKDHDQ